MQVDTQEQTPEVSFWRWFVESSDRLFHFEMDQEAVFDELSVALHQVDPNLTFEISNIQDGKREFVISADGILESFPAVQRLAAAAPLLDRWIVIPFRPPQGVGFIVDFGNFTLDPADVWFSHESDRDRTGLTIYVRGLLEENKEVAAQAMYILLDTALGEYDVETKIGFVELQPLTDDPEALGLIPFTGIGEVFDTVRH